MRSLGFVLPAGLLGPIRLAVALAVAFATCSLAAEDEPVGDSGKASELKRAAVNREIAATTQQLVSQGMLRKAQDMQTQKLPVEASRSQHFVRAAEIQQGAGAMEAAAFGNYDQAARNWRAAATEYARIKDSARAQSARDMADHAADKSRNSLRRAAAAYEAAANSFFGDDTGNDAERAAAASATAASLREKLSEML
ncbi:MAG: hypothetical protein PHR35_20155 [Kiritimatiellae bacterium]|nr:hypothetical protein [Kiritimatiellia bacterium]